MHQTDWRRQVEEYKGRLRAATDEVARLQRQLADRAQLTSARDSNELQSLRGTIEGLSVALGERMVELQQLKIQLAYEQQSVADAEVKSEVLRKRHREAEAESQRLRRAVQDALQKREELEGEIENLRQSWLRDGVDNSRSEGAGPP